MSDFIGPLTYEQQQAADAAGQAEGTGFDWSGLATGIVSIFQNITGGGPAPATTTGNSAADMAARAAAQEAAQRQARQRNWMIGGGIAVAILLVFLGYRAMAKKK